MRIAAPLLLLLILISGLCQAAEVVQASDRDSGLHVVRKADAWHLVQGSDEPLPLPLPLNFLFIPFALRILLSYGPLLQIPF